MILGLEISFDQFLLDLHLNEQTYILALQCMIRKPTLFLKHKPNDIQTNAFNIHAKPLWKTNTNAQFILNPYATITYCTSYFIYINKSVRRQMWIILYKCKLERIEISKRFKKLKNAFLNAHNKVNLASIYLYPSHYVNQQDHFNS
jgi:hypothetical protein